MNFGTIFMKSHIDHETIFQLRPKDVRKGISVQYPYQTAVLFHQDSIAMKIELILVDL